MDQKAKKDFAEIVLKAIEIQAQNWDFRIDRDGIPREQAALLAGADKDMAPFIGLILYWPDDARIAAEQIAPPKTKSVGR